MKKFLVLLFIFIFSSTGANAITSVKYMAGAPVGISRGVGPYMNYNNYYNSARIGVRPQHNHYGRPRRDMRPPVMGTMGMNNILIPPNQIMGNNIPKTNNRPMEVSRLSKDYAIPATKTYTRGNVTYYN